MIIKHRYAGEVVLENELKTLSGADLREADLREANLRGADLSEADLREADLRWADLNGADLSEADLRWADLNGADLRGADLREADLREADLSEADLRGADLSEADLNGANLSGADLRWANGDYSVFYGGRHFAWATCSHIGIGCKMHTHAEWREQYAQIGENNDYAPEEIERYRQWIFSLDWLIAKGKA